MYNYLFLILCFFACALPVHAGDNDIRFEHLSSEHGLSRPTVYTIIQDRQGFMWFGTEDGLNRYDGITFKVYKPDPDNPAGISSSAVNFLCEDSKGNIWICTRNRGLDKFDPKTETFTHYQHDDNNPGSLSSNFMGRGTICEDESGILWIGTQDGGLNRFDPDTQAFTHFRHDDRNPKSLSHDYVVSISPGASQNGSQILWIGTYGGGLNRFDTASGAFTCYRHDDDNPDSLSDDMIKKVYADPERNIVWIGNNAGLDKFDPVREIFTHYPHDENNPESLSHNNVFWICPDKDKTLWITALGGGLNHFDPETGKFVRYRTDPTKPGSLSIDSAHPVFQDRAGALWVGTWGGGVNRYDPQRKKFRLYQHQPGVVNGLSNPVVFSITMSRRSRIVWLGTFGGLTKFDPETEIFTHYKNDPDNLNSISHNVVSGVYEDRDGILWIATLGGLNRFDPETQTFTRYMNDKNNPSGISDNSTRSVSEDGQGNLWVGLTLGGLNRFDRKQETFTQYNNDPNDPRSLPGNNVWTLFTDSAGTLWIGTGNGLCFLERDKQGREKFVRFVHDDENPHSISENTAMSIYEENPDVMWIGTGMGLNRLDRKTGKFTHFFTKHGLPSNRIDSIVGDDFGNLWLGTDNGLSRFNLKTQTFRNFDVRDGLQSNLFYYPSSAKTRDGKIYVGGAEGLNVFYPEDITDNPDIPPVVLTDFQVDGKSARVGKDSVLKEHISFAREIILPPDISKFSFEFSALNYTVSAKNQYAYKMEGFDKDWVFTDSSRRFAHYTNLDPGEYVFRVKGSNNDGLWNEKGASVKIIILPPWWKTWRFRLLTAVFFIICAVGAFRWRMKIVQQAKFQKMFFSHSVPMLLIEPETGDIKEANAAATEFYGYSSSEMKGMNISQINGLSPEQIRSVIQRIKTNQQKSFNFQHRLKNKEIRIVEVRSTPIDVGGKKSMFSIVHDITEQKQAEEALKKSEALLKDMERIAKIGGWEFDAESGKQIWTDEVYRIHEVASDFEATVSKGLDFYEPESKLLIKQAIESAIEHGSPFDLELPFITAYGNHLWVHAVGKVEQINGKTVRVAGIFQDITGRKQAEDALRSSEERFRTIFEKSPISIELYDEQGSLTYLNQACIDIFGVSDPDDVIGLKLFENPNFSEDHKDRAMRGQAVRFESLYDFEQVRQTALFSTSKTGIIYIDALVTPLIKEHNAVFGYMLQIQDITHRRRTEDALREKERLMSDIINFLPDATFVIDRQGKVIAWNRAMETMTGIPAQDMLGLCDYAYSVPFYGERRPILIDLVLQSSEDIEKTYCQIQKSGDKMTAEHYYPDLQGKKTWLFGNASVLRNSQGDIIGAIESVRDITDKKIAEIELKKAKEEAEAAERVKNTFLANVSHHLRTPLNSVLGFSEIMAEDKSLSRQYQEYAAMIRRSGKDLLAIINLMLEVSKLAPESLGSDPRYQHLVNLLESCAVQAEPAEDDSYFPQAETGLRAEIRELPPALSDLSRGQLTQAVKALDIREILDIIAHIRLENAAAADTLEYLANRFEYEKILYLIEK